MPLFIKYLLLVFLMNNKWLESAHVRKTNADDTHMSDQTDDRGAFYWRT